MKELKIYDGAFLREKLAAITHELFLRKNSITDVLQGPKYNSLYLSIDIFKMLLLSTS